jgi:enamine deaminase RidA (YjgF/YER057c/UK114 family)
VKQARNPTAVHAPLAGYAHQIEVIGRERLLALSGQIGMTADGRVPDDAAAQLDLALENVLRNLEAARMTPDDLVKLTFYFTEPVDPQRRAAILAQRLGRHAPCMTLVMVAGLASTALKVEVDAWASSASPARRTE